MDYISPKQAAEKWHLSERRVQKLCECRRVEGAVRFGRIWLIPQNARKPVDARYKVLKEE